MPCEPMQTTTKQTTAQKAEQARVVAAREKALADLESKLRIGTVKLMQDRVTRKLRLEGWTERAGWQDGCALDALRSKRSTVLTARLQAIGATEQHVALTHGH